MRLSNYIYCTLTPSVCSCGTCCYAALPACSRTNAQNPYCHVQFALLHLRAKKNLLRTLHWYARRAGTVMSKLCCLICAPKTRTHANSECKNRVSSLARVEFCLDDFTCKTVRLAELSNRWYVALSPRLSQRSADEASDSSGNNLGLERRSNLFIEAVQSQQTYLYIHRMSLYVQRRLSLTVSIMSTGFKDISNRRSRVLV